MYWSFKFICTKVTSDHYQKLDETFQRGNLDNHLTEFH